MEENLAHETLHALYRTGRFTPVEQLQLNNPRLLAIWRERFGIDVLYKATPARYDEEAIATRFASAWSEAAAAGVGAHLRLQEPEETDPAIADAAALLQSPSWRVN